MLETFPLELADRCVKCAQCLPSCPTWVLAREEAESPRGRIALMQALATGAIEPSGEVLRHLDQCLLCRHCEAVCPADVPFGLLADSVQAELGPNRDTPPILVRLLRWAVARQPFFLTVVVPMLRLWSWLPIGRHRLLTPHAPAPPSAGLWPAIGERRGAVSLFLGCIARATDGATLQAAVSALTRNGFDVEIPASQGCCGALHQHAGDRRTAEAMAERNSKAFSGEHAVVTCASGCAATLVEHPAFGARVIDISTLLAGNMRASARPGTVIHTPCTLHTALHQGGAPAQLLAGARVLEARGRCCGAAGDYLLRQPALAGQLRDTLLDEIGEAAVICTSNPGCAMHLRAGIAARGWNTVVTHPVLESLSNESR